MNAVRNLCCVFVWVYVWWSGHCTEPACVYVAQKQDRFHCSRNPAPLLRASCVCVCLRFAQFKLSCISILNFLQRLAECGSEARGQQSHTRMQADTHRCIR